MSKIVLVRFPELQLVAMTAELARYNASPADNVPMTMSDFVRRAVAEKIAHMTRSRKGRRTKNECR